MSGILEPRWSVGGNLDFEGLAEEDVATTFESIIISTTTPCRCRRAGNTAATLSFAGGKRRGRYNRRQTLQNTRGAGNIVRHINRTRIDGREEPPVNELGRYGGIKVSFKTDGNVPPRVAIHAPDGLLRDLWLSLFSLHAGTLRI